MMYDAVSNMMGLYIIWNLAGWYSKLLNMNKRYIRKHDFSKWIEVCRNTKKNVFYHWLCKYNQKTSQEEVGTVKMSMCNTLWSVNVENASMIIHWIFATLPHSIPFLHNDSSIYHRILHFYMSRIPPWYVFSHPSNNTFNTWKNFISILGLFFRVPDHRH